MGAESRVTEIAPPQSGRSRYGNQYRLTVNGERHISVKLAYGGAQEIRWEVFHAHMRNLLGLPHYKLERKNGFPIQDWKGMEYIIMDWGMAGRRRSIAELCVRADVRKSPASPFQFGQVVAQDILFAAGDRKRDHIVWDLDKKAMFSIDHEMPAEDMEEIVMFFRNELGYVYGENWHPGSKHQNAFRDAFNGVWEKAHDGKAEILKCYREEALEEFGDGFSERLSSGSEGFLQDVLF